MRRMGAPASIWCRTRCACSHPTTQPPAARLDMARRVMRHLPESDWLRINRNFADHLTGGDAGLYDLLLNPRDRAFDVPACTRCCRGRAGGDGADGADALRPGDLSARPEAARARRRPGPGRPRRPGRGGDGNISTHVAYCVRAAERADARRPDGRRGGAGGARNAGRGGGARHPAGRHADLPVRRAARCRWGCRSWPAPSCA